MPTPCVFYKPNSTQKCSALITLRCQYGAPCPFYKTPRQFRAGNLASYKRLTRLKRQDLIKKYSSVHFLMLNKQ